MNELDSKADDDMFRIVMHVVLNPRHHLSQCTILSAAAKEHHQLAQIASAPNLCEGKAA
ncbi:hypothetical protein PbDSM24746_48420 [Paenibacillus macerans]|nr:hypothetical protein PbDSM24746_48420 [Paenibacillus macerans]GBK70727.1 hypothetical protein PbJCM17693_44350 [Paenibacillus macerans]